MRGYEVLNSWGWITLWIQRHPKWSQFRPQQFARTLQNIQEASTVASQSGSAFSSLFSSLVGHPFRNEEGAGEHI